MARIEAADSTSSGKGIETARGDLQSHSGRGLGRSAQGNVGSSRRDRASHYGCRAKNRQADVRKRPGKTKTLFHYHQLIVGELGNRKFRITITCLYVNLPGQAQGLRLGEVARHADPDIAHGQGRKISGLRMPAQIDEM